MRFRTDPERIAIPFNCFFLRRRLQRAKKRAEIIEGYKHLLRESNDVARRGEGEVRRRTLTREGLSQFFCPCVWAVSSSRS
jgi:hypothetical protein